MKLYAIRDYGDKESVFWYSPKYHDWFASLDQDCLFTIKRSAEIIMPALKADSTTVRDPQIVEFELKEVE